MRRSAFGSFVVCCCSLLVVRWLLCVVGYLLLFVVRCVSLAARCWLYVFVVYSSFNVR